MHLNTNLPMEFLTVWNTSLLYHQVQHALTKVYNNIAMLLHVEEYLFVPYPKEFKQELVKAIEPLAQWAKNVEPLIQEQLYKYRPK